MFWCPVCKCAYPHGQEGPAAAFEVHNAERHRGETRDRKVGQITGRHVVIGFLTLAILAWVGKFVDFTQLWHP
ncbi:hypothetical protein [Streptomyces sp. NBC_00470]|uniref:hypothetical protein n=1 Tax=Streptomyces sp. NBC_00470 TaxID=2975753 RepID=UPI002F909D09